MAKNLKLSMSITFDNNFSLLISITLDMMGIFWKVIF